MNALSLMNIAARVAREAGDVVSTGRRSGVGHISTKSSPTDLVTQWDTRAEALIRLRLSELRPGDGFLGEEGERSQSSTGITWVVDPIDGTTNFAYGIAGFAVSIAAVDDSGGVAAAVHAPDVRELFVAARDIGAWSNGRRLRCSEQTSLSLALVGTGFSYEREIRSRQLRLVAERGDRIRDLRRLGAASLDLCFVAAGRLDAYFETNLQPWDTAAGILIAREAGAIVTDFGGDSVDGGEVLASAPGIHGALVELLS